MHLQKGILAIIISVLIASILGSTAQAAGQAARGTPHSPEFGFGAHLSLPGIFIEESARLAGNIGLDWLAIEIPWKNYFPQASSQPDWSQLDKVMSIAASKNINVMLSITQPPAWARTPQGPDKNKTIQMVALLVQRYSNKSLAIELFPGANTLQEWGAQPNAADYVRLFAATSSRIQVIRPEIFWIAGGLISAAPPPSVDDLTFLQGLYDAGLRNLTSIISVQHPESAASPSKDPDTSEPRILQHYEEVRGIMLANGHHNGLIWITQLQPPYGKISQAGKVLVSSTEQQADWLTQAYTQIRTQLYIGVAFLKSLNPDQSRNSVQINLIQDQTNYHPFYQHLQILITQNAPVQQSLIPGRPKEKMLFSKRNKN